MHTDSHIMKRESYCHRIIHYDRHGNEEQVMLASRFATATAAVDNDGGRREEEERRGRGRKEEERRREGS